jgi:hypothetical protein
LWELSWTDIDVHFVLNIFGSPNFVQIKVLIRFDVVRAGY